MKIRPPVFAEGKERYTKSQVGYISALWGGDPKNWHGCRSRRRNHLVQSFGGVVVSVAHRQATTLGKLPTPMCLCHQAVQFGTGQRAVMLCLCSREATEREMSTPYAPTLGMVHFTFLQSTLLVIVKTVLLRYDYYAPLCG